MEINWTLEEVLVRYALEPTLRDVYVEGRSDKRLLEWFLDLRGVSGVSVYCIEVVDVPDKVLQDLYLPGRCNRSKILALSAALARHFPEGLKVLCVADRDFEDYMPTAPESKYLRLTDCNSMDLYPFTYRAMHKFVMVALGGLGFTTPGLMDNVVSVLEPVYACRLANEMLGWRMEWIPFTRYVRMTGYALTFDEEPFHKAYLQKNSKWGQRRVFAAKVEQAKGMLGREIGLKVRGHDLGELLHLLIRELRKDKKFGNAETVESCLLAAAESNDLEQTGLFQAILQMASVP